MVGCFAGLWLCACWGGIWFEGDEWVMREVQLHWHFTNLFGAERCAQFGFVIFLLFIFSSKHSRSNRKKAKNHQKTEYCAPLGAY